MEIEVTETKGLQEGPNTGEITKVEFRTEPYAYTDVYVKPKGVDFEVKVSAPTNLAKSSKLYNLLSKFTTMEEGQKVDPETVLKGQKVKFVTQNQTTPRGTFTNILIETIQKEE